MKMNKKRTFGPASERELWEERHFSLRSASDITTQTDYQCSATADGTCPSSCRSHNSFHSHHQPARRNLSTSFNPAEQRVRRRLMQQNKRNTRWTQISLDTHRVWLVTLNTEEKNRHETTVISLNVLGSVTAAVSINYCRAVKTSSEILICSRESNLIQMCWSSMNLKSNTNYNNIKISSGDSAVLYFPEAWHMQLRRNKKKRKRNCLDNIISVAHLLCTRRVIKAKPAAVMKLELWFMCYIFVENLQPIAYPSRNPIQSEAPLSHLSRFLEALFSLSSSWRKWECKHAI